MDNKPTPTKIYDLRNREAEFNLDNAGFQALSDATSMEYKDWADEDVVKSKYYDEVKELLKKRYGAHKVT